MLCVLSRGGRVLVKVIRRRLVEPRVVAMRAGAVRLLDGRVPVRVGLLGLHYLSRQAAVVTQMS